MLKIDIIITDRCHKNYARCKYSSWCNKLYYREK